MSRYRPKKIYEWSRDLGYITGLIASDGCIYKDGRHINLTSTDIDILFTFKNILKLKGSLGQKKSGYDTVGYYISFSDVSLYDFLVRIGITPGKSKTLGPLNIPKEFYPDFLRGNFDGDSSIYGYRDKRWPNSFMYYACFCSASIIFIQWLREQNSKYIKVSRGSLNWSSRVYVLRYAKADTLKIFEYMYYEDRLPCLNRKHDKLIDFIAQDPYPNKVNARVA